MHHGKQGEVTVKYLLIYFLLKVITEWNMKNAIYCHTSNRAELAPHNVFLESTESGVFDLYKCEYE